MCDDMSLALSIIIMIIIITLFKYLLLTLKTFWDIFSGSRDIQVFVKKLMMSQTVQINNKSQN